MIRRFWRCLLYTSLLYHYDRKLGTTTEWNGTSVYGSIIPLREKIGNYDHKAVGDKAVSYTHLFWLLLHLCDVKSEFSPEELEELYSNQTNSNRHTKVSCEVSKRAHHAKTITSDKFRKLYYPGIPQAIKNAESFSGSFPELFDHLGTNLPKPVSYTHLRDTATSI